MLIRIGNGADLVVVAQAEDGADLDLVGAHLGLGGRVEVADIAVDVGLVDRHRVLGALRRQHNHKVALRLKAEVAAHVVLEAPAEDAHVLALDGVDVGVGPPEEHVVENCLLGARPAHGVAQQVHVVAEGPADEGEEPLLQPAARLALNVGLEVAPVDAREGVADRSHLQGVLGGQDADQRLLVSAEALHG